MSGKKKWLRIWDEVSDRLMRLPFWVQEMIFVDIQATIENRILVMERIQKKKASK